MSDTRYYSIVAVLLLSLALSIWRLFRIEAILAAQKSILDALTTEFVLAPRETQRQVLESMAALGGFYTKMDYQMQRIEERLAKLELNQEKK